MKKFNGSSSITVLILAALVITLISTTRVSVASESTSIACVEIGTGVMRLSKNEVCKVGEIPVEVETAPLNFVDSRDFDFVSTLENNTRVSPPKNSDLSSIFQILDATGRVTDFKVSSVTYTSGNNMPDVNLSLEGRYFTSLSQLNGKASFAGLFNDSNCTIPFAGFHDSRFPSFRTNYWAGRFKNFDGIFSVASEIIVRKSDLWIGERVSGRPISPFEDSLSAYSDKYVKYVVSDSTVNDLSLAISDRLSDFTGFEIKVRAKTIEFVPQNSSATDALCSKWSQFEDLVGNDESLKMQNYIYRTYRYACLISAIPNSLKISGSTSEPLYLNQVLDYQAFETIVENHDYCRQKDYRRFIENQVWRSFKFIVFKPVAIIKKKYTSPFRIVRK